LAAAVVIVRTTKIILKLGLATAAALGLIFFSMHFFALKSTKQIREPQPIIPTQSSASKAVSNSPTDNSAIITVSSNAFPGDDLYAPEYLMQEGRTIWHAESPPNYPQWVEISFPVPVIITHFGIRSQGDGPSGMEHCRGPKNIVFQGSNESSESSGSQKSRKWRYLFKVENNAYAKGEEWKDWFFVNTTAFRYYRIYIKAGGDSNNLTIRQIRLDDASKLQNPVEPLPEHETIVAGPSANETLPSDFDWSTYVENYKDLQASGIDTKEKAAEHWLKIGRKEGRSYHEIPIEVPDPPYMPWRRN